MRGGDRYDWWENRRNELASSGQAMNPMYGVESCMDCGDMRDEGNYIFHPDVHAELIGEATAKGGGVISEICSDCWYEDHEEPPTERVDKQKQCDKCRKELVQVIVSRSEGWDDDEDEDEEPEPVEISVDMRRHVCTAEYATVYIEVPPAWADDPGYWDDEILEQALGEGYGPDWELETDIQSDEPAEITQVEVM